MSMQTALGRVAKSGLTVVGPSRQSVRKSVKPTGLYPISHKHLVGPPQVSIPFAEKAFWGAFMAIGILGTPAWVLCHLEDYKGHK